MEYALGAQLLWQRTGGGSPVQRWFHHDGQLSSRLLTTSTATVGSKLTYEAFGGDVALPSPVPTSFRYTGQQADAATSGYYLRARYMAPSVGRFLGADPWSGVVSRPMSLQRFLYAHADPINQFDPGGLQAILSGLMTIQSEPLLWQVYRIHFSALIPKEVKDEMLRSIIASNSPTWDDLTGGNHEEGGVWGLRGTYVYAQRAKPGKGRNPMTHQEVRVDISDPRDPADEGMINWLQGGWHVHPRGRATRTEETTEPAGPGRTRTRRTTETREWGQDPSARDFALAFPPPLMNVVFGARNEMVYFYGPRGTFVTMSVRAFFAESR